MSEIVNSPSTSGMSLVYASALAFSPVCADTGSTSVLGNTLPRHRK